MKIDGLNGACSFELDTKVLSSGAYLLTLTTDGKSYTKSFVINR